MTTDFEVFRRERNIRRQQGKATYRPEGSRQVWEELEEREANELKDEILNAECDDFFSDATRLVSTIVQRVSSDRQQEISAKLRHEMEEFLCDSIRHATNMIINLDWEKAQVATGEETFEPSLKNLNCRKLDEFRAEGTAQLGDRHFGQDPFGTELDGVRVAAGNTLQHTPPPAAPIPDVAQMSSPRPPVECQIHAQGIVDPPSDPPSDLPEDAPEDVSAVDEDTELIDPPRRALDCTAFGAGDAVPERMRLSEGELSVAFDTPDPTFEAEEFGARIAGVASIQRPTLGVDDEEDAPLAAVFAESAGAHCEDDSESENPAQTGAGEVEADGDGAPPSIDTIRDALRLLVQNGIMSPEQARAAFRRQTVS